VKKRSRFYGPVGATDRDGNKENIALENLDCMHGEEAKRLYNYGNQHGYKRALGKASFCR
jgi:hypothetical protein